MLRCKINMGSKYFGKIISTNLNCENDKTDTDTVNGQRIQKNTDTDTVNGQRYFYFLNGHNDVVYFSDQNFTEDKIETYEYDSFGNLEIFGDVNSFLFNSFNYDKDIGLYQIPSGTFYNPNLGLVIKNMVYSKEAVPIGKEINIYPEVINNVIVNLIPTDSEGPSGGGGEDGDEDLPVCGDGDWDPGEQCDDGNQDNTDCCDINCKVTGNCRPFKPTPIPCKWTKIFDKQGNFLGWACIPPTI